MRALLVVALSCAAFGCDSRAKASDPTRADQKSKEYETCSSSASCQDELRCFEHVCRRTARSAVGDYFAALGVSLRAKGDLEGAIDAYNRALGHYDSEKIALPPDVDCGYGAALAAAKSKKEHAELGARVLHRCILAVPVGSALRDRALADLATLADAGLDPLALGRTALADVYLTRAASTGDKVTVTVAANPQPSGKTYQGIPDKLADPDVVAGLGSCLHQYATDSHKDTLVDTISVKSSYTPSEYEDEQGTFSMKIDPASGIAAGSPEAAADKCVRSVVEPAIKGLTTVRDAFSTKLTITVK